MTPPPPKLAIEDRQTDRQTYKKGKGCAVRLVVRLQRTSVIAVLYHLGPVTNGGTQLTKMQPPNQGEADIVASGLHVPGEERGGAPATCRFRRASDHL